MKLYKIETGNLKLDGGAMFGVVPKVIWGKIYPADENNLCIWAMRCLLIENEGKKILIDTGMGDKQSEKFYSYYYPNSDYSLESSLNKHGFNFEDITDVILTHLHFDHAGGAVKYNEKKELVPTFPNAIYHVSKKQWEWAVEANRREKASFLHENFVPLQKHNKLNLLEKEGEIFPSIDIKFFNGHTNGQIIPYINYNGKTLVYCADLFPSTAHIPMPYIMGYDTRPLITLDDRQKFFDEAIENEQILFFEHDLYTECCTLQNTPKGARVKDKFSLKDFLENI